MKAVLLKAFGGVENLEYREWPEPVASAGEVKIKTRTISVNPTDYKARQGGSGGVLPMLLGRDAAGVVESVGEGVKDIAPGDEVMVYLPRFGESGGEGYAEFVKVPREFVAKKPVGLSFAEAAAVPLVSLTAYECVAMKSHIQPGESAFVAGGSGGVGTMAIQMLRHLGADPIITTAGSDESAAYIHERLGVPEKNIIRYTDLSLDELEVRIIKLNDGRLPRATLDLVGKEMKKLCVRVVDYWGHFVSCAPEPGAPIDDFFHSQNGPMFTKSASFHSVFLRSPVRGGGKPYWGTFQASLETIRGWLETGAIKPPLVEEIGPLSAENIGAAHRRLEGGHTRGKLVLTVGE